MVRIQYQTEGPIRALEQGLCEPPICRCSLMFIYIYFTGTGLQACVQEGAS
uniref:Uncharacterized protein n=1 Tax=Anguilla anguilla TaxID=7936 RepID=A0A0E9U9Q8_ANGAN